ncbi:MAG TPA: DUF3857 domain-containing protein [Phnomibacter sp.]|nr:DUF3857 domain-containing protein [Phnomibacter sp.]
MPGIRQISYELLKMKDCDFDSGAAAMVVFHSAETFYDGDNGNMITKHRKRIKIFNKNGMGQANFLIRFYSKEGFEFIGEIEGESCTLDANGKPVFSEIAKESIFRESIDPFWSQMKVMVPNVVEGSVFEIRYTSTMKHYGGLDYWDFQETIPTVKSSYLLEIPPGAEFAYSVQKAEGLSFNIEPMPREGKIYFEMSNVPGLTYEPYMDAPRNYLQRVIFQLASYQGVYGGKNKVNNTWEDLVRDLMSHEDFGKQLNKKLSVPELDEAVIMQKSTEDKVRLIYNYVRKKVQWDHYYGKYSIQGVKTTLEKGVGSTADINLLLLNLLQQYEITCYPLLVADRDFGKVNVNYPFIDKFSKVVAYALVDSSKKAWIMDASQKEMPANLTPYQLLNTIALVVDKKKPILIRIVRPGDRFQKYVTIESTLDTDRNEIVSKVKIERHGYAKLTEGGRANGQFSNPIADVDEEKMSIMEVVSSTKQPAEEENAPNVHLMTLRDELPDQLGTLYLNSTMFLGIGKNPFNSSKRFSDVNFGYPISLFQVERVKLPAGTKLKEPWNEKTLAYTDNSIVFNRKVELNDNVLIIKTNFQQTVTLVPAKEYDNLRNFYANMLKVLELPVVLQLPVAAAQ